MTLTKPIILALYGGPGTGKSTTAALVFGALKQAGVNVELVHEVAKDFTWERRTETLKHQPYVIAKQLRNYDRLNGQVDVIVTDTSSLLGLIYAAPDTLPEFRDWLVADWKSRNTIDVFLERDPIKPYQQAGRSQTRHESALIDSRLEKLLQDLGIPFTRLNVDYANGSHVDQIVDVVLLRLTTYGQTAACPCRGDCIAEYSAHPDEMSLCPYYKR